MKKFIPIYGLFVKTKFKNDIEWFLYLIIHLMSIVYLGIFIVYLNFKFNLIN